MNQDIGRTVTIESSTRLVTRPRGSWRWQQPYALSSYSLQVAADGTSRLIWRNVGRSSKRSMPQLKALVASMPAVFGWDGRGVPAPVSETLESHPASPYNRD
jgi:hypothetical protein